MTVKMLALLDSVQLMFTCVGDTAFALTVCGGAGVGAGVGVASGAAGVRKRKARLSLTSTPPTRGRTRYQ